jgi:hypothetical protein
MAGTYTLLREQFKREAAPPNSKSPRTMAQLVVSDAAGVCRIVPLSIPHASRYSFSRQNLFARLGSLFRSVFTTLV